MPNVQEKWCFEPRDCGVCRSDRRYSSALLEVLLQMAQNKAARSRSGWQEAQKIAHKFWMGEVPRKGPKTCQTGISAVDSLAIHSLITCCSSSRESFWMIYTDGFLDDLQWWLLTKNRLISRWFTKNQLITHQKRFAHQDCAATVPKIQWYVWYVLVQLECWFTSWNWRYSWPWAIMGTMRGLWTQLFFGILMRIFVFSKRILAMLKDGE